jgi:phosphopantetheinyl transferase (holo-ACP synthase)
MRAENRCPLFLIPLERLVPMSQDRPSIPSRAEAASPSPEITPVRSPGGDPVPAGPIRGTGIGIETVATFPDVENFLEDAFYRARFTPAELTYLAELASPRSGFCALAAVKRAIMNSGAAGGTPESLAAIEITRDETGKPSFPDCSLSVDQSETTAVAVCLWVPQPMASAPIREGRPLESYPLPQRLAIRVLMGLAGLSLVFVFGAGAWFILRQIFH